MLFFGHPWVESPTFTKVSDRDAVKKSTANSVVLLSPLACSHDLARYCQKQGVVYAVETETLEEALLANAMGAKYLLCEAETALMLQPIAQEYLFDARILQRIDDQSQIDKAAKAGIDGVIFPEAIV